MNSTLQLSKKNCTVKQFNDACDKHMLSKTGIGLIDCTSDGNVDADYELGWTVQETCEHIINKHDLDTIEDINFGHNI